MDPKCTELQKLPLIVTALKYNFWVLASQNFWVYNRKENNEIKIKQFDVMNTYIL